MKNKEKLKKFLVILSLYTIFVIFLTYSINKYEYQVYKDNFDTKITSIILKIKEDYPDIVAIGGDVNYSNFLDADLFMDV